MKLHQQKPSLRQSPRFSLGGGMVWLCVGMFSLGYAAFAEPEEAEGPQTYREIVARLDPMDTSGANRPLASVLNDYYKYNFGGRPTWEAVESIRFEGDVVMAQGSFRFIAFKKKPDYCKVVLINEGQPLLVMGYDGEDAWQMNLAESKEARSMSVDEALNFIRDATTGGHLFHPQFPGEMIELKGSTLAANRRCFELLVTLPNGQRITSLLGMLDFREYQQITENAITGKREVITHTEFIEHEGIRLPARSELTVDDELVHTVIVQDVQFNLGVMPWMFARSSGALLKGGAGNASVASPQPVSARAIDPLRSDSFSPFAEPSAFDLSETEVQSLLDDIGKSP